MKDKVTFAQLKFEVRIGCQEGIWKGTPPQETWGGVRSHSVFASNQAPEVAVGESGLLEGSTPMPRNERQRGQLQSLEVLPPVGPCRACPRQASRTPLPLPVPGSWRLGAAGRG